MVILCFWHFILLISCKKYEFVDENADLKCDEYRDVHYVMFDWNVMRGNNYNKVDLGSCKQ